MACSLDTYTPPNQPSNHRISFSNDFAEAHHQMGRPISQAQTPPPPSSDFEFLVSDYTMISAEELFFKGQLVPQKPNNTLREEMLLGDEDDDMFSFGPKKSSIKWKELFGLKKAQSGPKMVNKDERLVEKGPILVLEHKARVSNILHG